MAQVAFVIPTKRDKVLTLSSIPTGYQVHVIRQGRNAGEARNIGIRRARARIIILCDDDLAFDEQFLNKVITSTLEDEITGLEGYYPFERWLITRFMVFHKSVWQKLGFFEERRNQGYYGDFGTDTDFCLRAEKMGINIKKLSQDSVYHYEHDRKISMRQKISWLLFLWKRHAAKVTVPIVKLGIRRITGIQL